MYRYSEVVRGEEVYMYSEGVRGVREGSMLRVEREGILRM